MTSRVRREHLALADDRAMEEQAMRLNPVNAKKLTSNRRENTLRLSGQGATPSMGLSEFRGGSWANPREHYEKQLAEMKKKKGGSIGSGTKKGQMRLTARRAYEPEHEEAHGMGHHLGKHLHSLHGPEFHQAFLHGLSGGAWYDFLDPHKNGVGDAFNKVKNEFVNPSSVLRHDIAPKVANEFTDPNSILRGKVIPIGAQVAQYASPFIDAALPGLGTAINTGFKAANYANKGAKMVGLGEASRAKAILGSNRKGRMRNNGPPLLSGNVDGVWSGSGMLDEPMPINGTNLSISGSGMTGAYEGQGHSDGRRRRAECVKKVMREKGMKMIEASKYVKEHGLY